MWVTPVKKTPRVIVVLCILFPAFLDGRWKDNRFRIECLRGLPEFNLLFISPSIWFWFFLIIVPKYLNFATFSEDLLAGFILWLFKILTPTFSSSNSSSSTYQSNLSLKIRYHYISVLLSHRSRKVYLLMWPVGGALHLNVHTCFWRLLPSLRDAYKQLDVAA